MANRVRLLSLSLQTRKNRESYLLAGEEFGENETSINAT